MAERKSWPVWVHLDKRGNIAGIQKRTPRTVPISCLLYKTHAATLTVDAPPPPRKRKANRRRAK